MAVQAPHDRKAFQDPQSIDWTTSPETDPGHQHTSGSIVGVSGYPLLGTGLPGATAATRYAGGTVSGAPVSGTFQVGDYVIDQSGAEWVCTVAGTPGTWVEIGAAPVTSVFGRTGAVVAQIGDYSISQITGAGALASLAAGTGLSIGAGNLNIANTAVTAGSYGDAADVATFTVNAQGQLTAAASVAISVTHSAISDWSTATSAATLGYLVASNNLSDLTNAGTARTNLGLGALATLGVGTGLTSSGGNLNIASTITAAGPIGDASHVAQITYNARGQLTTVTSVAIAIAQASITDLPISPANGGTGVANNAASTLTITGAHTLAFTIAANTSLTLPASGTVMVGSNNLSEITSASTARTNLGLGAIATQGDPLGPTHGGTGIAQASASSTLTISGAFATTLTVTAATSLTLPTSGTVTALGNSTTGSGNIVLATAPTVTTLTVSSGGAAITGTSSISTTGTGAPLTLTATGLSQFDAGMLRIHMNTSGFNNPILWLDTNFNFTSGWWIYTNNNGTALFQVLASGAVTTPSTITATNQAGGGAAGAGLQLALGSGAATFPQINVPCTGHVGTGTLCTLGKTGGAGAPTTVAMATWLAIWDATGAVAGFIPVWH